MENKKSVLLYCDIIHTVEKLDNETAGLLFKHYLRYINDKHPTTDNPIVDIAFEAIKQNLKRDLKKWEKRAERSRENGSKGGRPKNPTEPKEPSGLNGNPDEPRKPVIVKDNVTVKVTDTVKVNGIDTKKKKKTPTGGSETSSLFTHCKSEFTMQYLALTGNEFYFNAKSAGSLKTLINQIKYSVKEKKEKDSAQKEKSATDTEVLESLQYILMNLPDWYKQNLSLAILSSKYNELINQLRNGKGSKIKQAHDLQAGLARIDAMPD